MTSVNMNLRLVSFDLCPFVQRAAIVLREKGVPHDIQYIDLADKPAWFLEISPLGKVPALIVDNDRVLFESAVIAEYIDETTPGRFMPAEPFDRAVHRMWVEFISTTLMDNWRLMMAPDEETAQQQAGVLRTKFERLEKQLGAGPLFAGTAFSLVDAAAAPMLQRTRWIEVLAPELGLTDGLTKLTGWTDALLQRDSVKGSMQADAHEVFIEYLKGRGSATRKEPAAWLGTRA